MSEASRSVLVTGASRGIGAATARAFAEAGERVALNYASSTADAQRVLDSLPGSGHVLAPGDVRDAGAVHAMVEHAAEQLGGIDVLVNNAGVYAAHPIGEVSYEEWQRVVAETFAVNLVGPANVLWCVLRHMGAGGRIVNVASRGAYRGEPDHPAYAASKSGLVSFGQSLARALGPRGIAVTSIAPGWVQTEMVAEILEGDSGAQRRRESPLDRVATPEEVAAAIVYLASPQAEFASGAVLDFNGASYLRI